MKRIITSRYLAFAFRLYIGGIFISAGMYKINYTNEFAEAIAGYQIVPFWAVNFTAVVMPWAELICGAMLVAGIKTKSATVAIAAMLAIFTAAILSSLLRDIPVGCGCFSSVEEPMSWTTLLRDLAWLAMSIHVYFFDSMFHLGRRFITTIKDVQP